MAGKKPDREKDIRELMESLLLQCGMSTNESPFERKKGWATVFYSTEGKKRELNEPRGRGGEENPQPSWSSLLIIYKGISVGSKENKINYMRGREGGRMKGGGIH